MSRPVASIVIRCYNEVDHIGGVLDAVSGQSTRDFEIVVVDSGSTDGTLDVVAKHDVVLVHIAKEDFSFGRSLNKGCAAATGEFLVFLSAHCYPTDERWLENLLKGFETPDIVAVYGRQRGVPGKSPFSERQILRRWFPDESSVPQEGPFMNHANSAVRRSVWEEHPYDETLPGLEDVAWADQITSKGFSIAYKAEATVHHIHDETKSQTRNRYQREAITFQKVFPGEHFNFLDFIRLSIRSIGADWRAARKEGVLAGSWAGIIGFRVAQFWGTFRGFHTRWPSSSELKRRFYYPEA